MLLKCDRFIGEETKSTENLTESPTWIIDPIDGTNNFVHGDENCVISVALAVNKQLEIGIVYSPVKDQFFTAQKGKGAFLNGKPIHVSLVEGEFYVIFSDKICCSIPYMIFIFKISMH